MKHITVAEPINWSITHSLNYCNHMQFQGDVCTHLLYCPLHPHSLLAHSSLHINTLLTALEQVNVVVTAITGTSLWSVVGGSVARSEVVWRETDRGTESSTVSLTGTSYTIDQLESTTMYTVTIRATRSNVAGITESQPIVVSTGR